MANIYSVPSGRNITISFFEPRKSAIKVRGGEIIGGGWMGIAKGRSANLVLLKDRPDDLQQSDTPARLEHAQHF